LGDEGKQISRTAAINSREKISYFHGAPSETALSKQLLSNPRNYADLYVMQFSKLSKTEIQIQKR